MSIKKRAMTKSKRRAVKPVSYRLSSGSKCPRCNAKLIVEYEPQWQEFPGSHPNPATTDYSCPKCGYFKSMKEPVNKKNIR